VYVYNALFGISLIRNSGTVCKLAGFTNYHVKHVSYHI